MMTSANAIQDPNSQGHWLDSWHVNPSANREYDFIDGLRGIAILMVLGCHIFYFNPGAGTRSRFAASFLEACGGGVVLFFALSGFLISWPFWKRKAAQKKPLIPPGYASRRFWKIYPPLALSVLILAPICNLLAGDPKLLITAACEWLAGISFFLPVSGRLNPVMWTLVVEVQFYLALPFVFLLCGKISFEKARWLIPGIFLLVPVIYRAATGLLPVFYPDINAHFPSALDAFCFGILLAGFDAGGLLVKRWARLAWVGVALWPATMLLYACLETHPQFSEIRFVQWVPWLEKIASFFLLLLVADPRVPLARWLCAPWLRWCGVVSYEWYLFHQPIALWLRQFVGPAHGNLWVYVEVIAGSLLLSAAITAVVYRFYSLPILKFGRNRAA